MVIESSKSHSHVTGLCWIWYISPFFEIWKHSMSRIVFFSQISLVSIAQSNNHASITLPPRRKHNKNTKLLSRPLVPYFCLCWNVWAEKGQGQFGSTEQKTLVQSCAKAVIQGWWNIFSSIIIAAFNQSFSEPGTFAEHNPVEMFPADWAYLESLHWTAEVLPWHRVPRRVPVAEQALHIGLQET